jgi:hypothetical protein
MQCTPVMARVHCIKGTDIPALQPLLGRNHLHFPTCCPERRRGPIGGPLPNCTPITRRIERGVSVNRVPNPLSPRLFPPLGLLLLQLKTPRSLSALFRWRDSALRVLSYVLCFPLAGIATTLVACVRWRSQGNYLVRPCGVVLLVSPHTQRAVPGQSSPMPMRMETTRRSKASEWPFGNT